MNPEEGHRDLLDELEELEDIVSEGEITGKEFEELEGLIEEEEVTVEEPKPVEEEVEVTPEVEEEIRVEEEEAPAEAEEIPEEEVAPEEEVKEESPALPERIVVHRPKRWMAAAGAATMALGFAIYGYAYYLRLVEKMRILYYSGWIALGGAALIALSMELIWRGIRGR